MKHRLLLLLLFMFVTSAVGWAQKSAPLSFTVKGILLDSLTQEGEPYATIRITKKSAPNKAVDVYKRQQVQQVTQELGRLKT